MTPGDEPDLRGAEGESRAQRLGSALRGLAADVVSERQKVAELRRNVAELTSRLEAVQATQSRDQAQPAALLGACPPWARWNGELERRYTLGVEEELMLLERRELPRSLSRAIASSRGSRMSSRSAPRRRRTPAVIELRTGIHTNVDGVVGELAGPESAGSPDEVGAMGLSAAAAGAYPLRTLLEETCGLRRRALPPA